MEVTEIQDGIKRLCLNDFNTNILRGRPGEDKTEALKIYLNNEKQLGIKKILDIVACEECFGYWVYYKE